MTFSDYALAWAHQGDPTTKLILLALAEHADSNGRCWPSIGRLAALTGLHRATVIRVLGRLETDGVIERTRSTGRSTRYKLLLVAQSDQSQSATGSTERPNQSHSATTPVAESDSTSRTVRHEPISEASIEPPTEPARAKVSISDLEAVTR